MQADIVLFTFKAGWNHTALGLRYLKENLGELSSKAVLLELDSHTRVQDAIEAVLGFSPRIVALSCHIWNISMIAETARILKLLRPGIFIMAGGPEVSFEAQDSPIYNFADYIITGEGEKVFPVLCGEILSGKPRQEKIIHAGTVELCDIAMPYRAYSEADIKGKIVYVESSRGCPFKCEFCLSSLDDNVRYFELERFLEDLENLYDRGARHFKFIDRTFNINRERAVKILDFFGQRISGDLSLHFEVVPECLGMEIMLELAKFPPGVVQLEAGVQSLNSEVAGRIGRMFSSEKTAETFGWLRQNTRVHIHADLIAGLPGESLESFAHGFDQLRSWEPQEIQVGVLKRLRGTPVSRHTEKWGMKYSPLPPYEVLETGAVSYQDMNRLKRFARFFDLVVNSGNFIQTCALFSGSSDFHTFMEFSDWAYNYLGQVHEISRARLAGCLLKYLLHKGVDEKLVHEAVYADLKRTGHRELPAELKSYSAKVRLESRGKKLRQHKHALK